MTGTLGFPKLTIAQHPAFPNNYSTRGFFAFTDIAKLHPLAASKRKQLLEDERFRAIDGKMINAGGGGSRLELERLLAWYIWRVNEDGAANAERSLETFLDSDELPVLNVLWLYSLELDETLTLPDGTQIVPLQEMIDSDEKERFLLAQFELGYRRGPVPRSALVAQTQVPKVLADRPIETSWLDTSVKLQRAALILNCVPGVCSAPAYSTGYCPPEVPLGPFGGGGGGSPVYDVLPLRTTKLSADQAETIGRLLAAFDGASPIAQDRIGRGLRRLAQAKGRAVDFDDKALDLGIALEMVLLGAEHRGQERPDQLSLNFRLRGSWLVGKTLPQRRHAYKALREIYVLRSQVAHSGSSERLQKLDYERREQLLASHLKIAEEVFQSLILQGFPSDWTEVILGARHARGHMPARVRVKKSTRSG